MPSFRRGYVHVLQKKKYETDVRAGLFLLTKHLKNGKIKAVYEKKLLDKIKRNKGNGVWLFVRNTAEWREKIENVPERNNDNRRPTSINSLLRIFHGPTAKR